MINLDLNNLINKIILIVLVVVLLYLGWKIRKIYKRFIFFLHKKRGRNSERKAIKLLKLFINSLLLKVIYMKMVIKLVIK